MVRWKRAESSDEGCRGRVARSSWGGEWRRAERTGACGQMTRGEIVVRSDTTAIASEKGSDGGRLERAIDIPAVNV